MAKIVTLEESAAGAARLRKTADAVWATGAHRTADALHDIAGDLERFVAQRRESIEGVKAK